MGCVKTDGSYINIRVPKEFIENQYVQKLLDLVSIEEMTAKSTLAENDAVALSDEVNETWWQQHKEQFLKGVQ